MSGITVASDEYFYQFNLDFSVIYLAEAFVRSGTLFRVTYASGESEEFRGEELTFSSDGKLVSGKVTSYASFNSEGKKLVQIEGSAVDAIAEVAETSDIDDDPKVLMEVLKGNDTLAGGKYGDQLAGFDGNDILNGLAGHDMLYGYDGDDYIIGGAGKDSMHGGLGSDTASYANATAGVTASLAAPSTNTNDAYGDRYFSIENLTGSQFADVLTGNSLGNSLSGRIGNDTLIGGAGNDKLYGGAGADQLVGGAGADRFVFQAVSDSASSFDTILDFLPSDSDRIDLSAIDANTNVSGSQAFTFIGAGKFSGVAGELRYLKLSTETFVYGDVNGDGFADLKIHLPDSATLTQGYFIL